MVLVGNRECNTERGFKNQLYIELGLIPYPPGGDFGPEHYRIIAHELRLILSNCLERKCPGIENVEQARGRTGVGVSKPFKDQLCQL